MAGTSALDALLTSLRGLRVVIVPMTDRWGRTLGNHGDALMLRVFEQMLSMSSVIKLPFSMARDADVVLVPPNGALLEIYSFPRLLRDRLQGLEKVPLVVFPSSALFELHDPSAIFEGRTAETHWFLREKYSYSHLSDRWGASLRRSGVELILSHDVVVAGSRYVPDLIGAPLRASHILVAGRSDREASPPSSWQSSVTQASWLRKWSGQAFMVLPESRLRSRLGRKLKSRQGDRAASGLLASLPTEELWRIDEWSLPQVRFDVSAPQLATFDEYRRALRDSAAVVTDRLHVAIPAALLGKPVYLVDGGYHKLRGVYEHSLASLRNATFVARS